MEYFKIEIGRENTLHENLRLSADFMQSWVWILTNPREYLYSEGISLVWRHNAMHKIDRRSLNEFTVDSPIFVAITSF